jgi:hypothetical protein
VNKEIFSFVIYMIHAYEILHTQSTEYVIKDIEEYLNIRGISL